MIFQADFFLHSKEIIRMLGEFVGIFLVGILVGFVSNVRREKSKFRWNSKKEKKFVEKHSMVHELMTELRVTIRASRVLIFQFHNGGNFADGMSIKKFSVTHESCESGVSNFLLDSQDVLITRYTDMIETMEKIPSKVTKTTKLTHSAFRSALEINKVELFSITPLKCDDGISPLGFLCCHWCSEDLINNIQQEGISMDSVQQIISDSVQDINSHLFLNSRDI